MESKRKASSKSNSGSGQKIKNKYREFLLSEEKKPSSVFAFCQKIGIKEPEFYKHFSSFESIERTIWLDHATGVISKLREDSNYTSFSVKEKILTFYFAVFESFKTDRSFLLLQLESWRNPAVAPSFLKHFNQLFSDWSKGLVEEGIQSGQIAKRLHFDQYYHHLLWMHFLFVLKFWSQDESIGFEKTDVAIEKSVALAFDLMGKGVLDNAIDFGKFLYQTAKN